MAGRRRRVRFRGVRRFRRRGGRFWKRKNGVGTPRGRARHWNKVWKRTHIPVTGHQLLSYTILRARWERMNDYRQAQMAGPVVPYGRRGPLFVQPGFLIGNMVIPLPFPIPVRVLTPPPRIRTPPRAITPPGLFPADMSEEEMLAMALAMSMAGSPPKAARVPTPPLRVPTQPRAPSPQFFDNEEDFDMACAIALSMGEPLPVRKIRGARPPTPPKAPARKSRFAVADIPPLGRGRGAPGPPGDRALMRHSPDPGRYPPAGPNTRASPAPLLNNGNTCYMNSCLQIILNCDDFGAALFRCAENLIPVYGPDAIQNGTRFLSPFLHLRHSFNEMRGNPNIRCLGQELWRFKQEGLARYHRDFSLEGSQQDATEMVMVTFNFCGEELAEYGITGMDNPIDQFFRVAKATFNDCPRCGHVKIEGELATMASVLFSDANERTPTSVQMCINYTYNGRCDNDHLTCPKCDTKGMIGHEGATSVGKYLAIQIPRFTDLGKSKKHVSVDPFIAYPIYDPTRGTRLRTIPMVLRAVICHLGVSAITGHYIAFVQNYRDNSWYCCDDEYIIRLAGLPNDRLVNENGYCFLYEKQ